MKRTVSIIGGGWRTACWIKVLNGLSEGYIIKKVYCRNEEKRKTLQRTYNVVGDDYSEIFSDKPGIVILCVSRESNIAVAKELVKNGLDVLCETPLFLSDEDFAEIEIGANYGKLFVAENYPFHPVVRAYENIIESGAIGEVCGVNVSYCHGYHAASIIRGLLGVGTETPDEVKSVSFGDRYADIYYRNGKIPEKINDYERTISFLRYGEKTAIYDFSHGQYFSPIRERRICVYGEKGEIVGDEVRYVKNGEEFSGKIERIYDGTQGSLFPLDLKRITFNGKTVFENPYYGKGFSEEEISMAECLSDKIKLSLKCKYTLNDSVCDCKTAKMIEH